MQTRLSATLTLDQPVSCVKQVSPARAKALKGLGICTVSDLLAHFPRRYVDLSCVCTIANAQIGSQCTIVGSIYGLELKQPKPKLKLVEITIVDGTSTLIVTCFRQPWLAKQLQAGMRIAVAGKVEFNYGFKRMINPYMEVLSTENNAAYGMIIPVHGLCDKISATVMRSFVKNALAMCTGMYDPLPLKLRVKYRLMSKNQALNCIHFPKAMQEVAQARRRIVYEELLLLELKLMQQNAARTQGQQPEQHITDGSCVSALNASLPFALTEEQTCARNAILQKMAENAPMNHMLLGDVGTGKTIVAAFALAAAADTNAQACLLAPTEVLATQHAKTLGALFSEIGVSWALLTGSTTAKARVEILEQLACGKTDVLISTHAALEPDVKFSHMSLAVIDEQQRFGVEQRKALLSKGVAPDVLYLTATPIPRSLALATFGGTSLSYLKSKPNAGAARETFVLDRANIGTALDSAKDALKRGEQVYIVCPLVGQDADARDERAGSKKPEIDEEASTYTSVAIENDADLQGENIAAATKQGEYLQNTAFIDWKVEVLHGKMKPSEKQEVMQHFVEGSTQVLVSTTVIEVGIDVPNATVMIIQDADRFGLSQLHQLRGRVGRGEKPAKVYLVSTSKSPIALQRLCAMEGCDDGFKLAKFDLSLRREGDILGNRQHGAGILKLVNIVRDEKVIEAAHGDATEILKADPKLQAPENQALAIEVSRAFES